LGAPVSARTLKAGRRAIELRRAGARWADVVDALTAEGFRAARGGSTWTLSMAHRAARSVELTDQARRLRAG